MFDLFTDEQKNRAFIESLTGKTIMSAWQDMAAILAITHPDATDEELEALDAAMHRSLRG